MWSTEPNPTLIHLQIVYQVDRLDTSERPQPGPIYWVGGALPDPTAKPGDLWSPAATNPE